jgi:hypothetical protein
MTYATGKPPDDLQPYLADKVFFTQTLPGWVEPLGSPGGAAKIGPLDIDRQLVASLPRAEEAPGE